MNTQQEKQLKKRNAELENELAAKNRELKIETALEKVRSIALSMKEPADMLAVCKTISLKLQSLGVKEIRNVQTAIFYQSKGTYMNYEYYAKHNKTFITETNYTNHKIHKAFAANMLKGKGDFFISHIKGKKVKDWIAFQKTTNVFIDRFLEKASSLNYYWHSLGPVALGISTYVPLTAGELQLFKDFLKVFQLAYRRYMDIEQAIIQAREARIEASLERVRAVAMSMNKPEDLLNVSETLYREFHSLGFPGLRNSMINIHNDEKKTFVNYDYSDEMEKSINHLTYNIHPLIEKQIQQIRSANDAFSETVFEGDDLKAMKKFRKKIGEKDDPRIKKANALYYYFYSIGTGSIGISTFKPINDEHLALLKKFRNVFSLSYQRYTDISLAEAQTREASIELALERVRARTMAMHHSDELSETAAVLFQEFKKLGEENLIQFTIGIYHENEREIEFRVTDWAGSGAQETKPFNLRFNLSMEEPTLLKPFVNAWKEKKKSFTVDLSGKKLEGWLSYRNKMTGLNVKSKDTGGRRVVTGAFFSKGLLSISEPMPLSEDTIKLLERFAAVFDGTYTRFLDLQKAEAQARDATIETALERVRSKTMAMHNSQDVGDTVATLFEEFVKLSIHTFRCGIGIIHQEKKMEVWTAKRDANGKVNFFTGHMDMTIHPLLKGAYSAWKKKQDSYVYELKGDDLKEYFSRSNNNPNYPLKYDIPSLPSRLIFSVFYFPEGFLFAFTLEELSAQATKIFKRFSGVFGQTYRRFLDLQKAEAQSREAQIELGLERVRAKAMAMQSSSELAELVDTVFKELTKLDLLLDRCIIMLYDAEKNDSTWWIAAPESDALPISVFVKYHEYAPYLAFIDAWHKRILKWRYVLEGTTKKEWDDFIFSETEMALLPTAVKDGMKSFEKIFLNVSFNNFGSLTASSFESLPEEQFEILLRFAKVFDSTYTRFLDLQKAEAQAREAKIEAALERVRSQSMAMHHSDQLHEVIEVVTDQFHELGFRFDTASFMTNYSKDELDMWVSTPGVPVPPQIKVPYTSMLFFDKIGEALENNLEFLTTHFTKKEKNSFFRQFFTKTDAKHIPEERKNYVFNTAGLAASTVLLNKVFLMIVNYDGVPYTEDENTIIKRFAKVFEQTYTRFLDLQKAEAQARESQIELGLERVRARAMAMQKSDELAELVVTVFKELTKLDFALKWCIINIIDEISMTNTVWAANPDIDMRPESYYMKFQDYPYHHAMIKAWKERKAKSVYTLEGQEKQIYDDYLFSETEFKRTPEIAQSASRAMSKYVCSFSFSNFGGLQTVGEEPLSEASMDILARFGKVFDLTYTRFNDLQKAEAQTRQAKIEAAMEKVRSRAMAMHKPNELVEVAELLRTEMGLLGIEELETSSIYIHNETTQQTQCWYAIQDQQQNKLVSDHMTIDLKDTWVGREMLTFYRSDKKQTSVVMQGKARKEWINYCADNSKVLVGFYGETIPDRTYHLYKFSNGYMGAASPGDISTESWDLLQRATAVFSLAYTRFSDLQLAEAQARESQIEAALERVRSSTLAMQKSDELAETAAVLFKQLINLGIEPNRLYINIVKNETGEAEFWITDEDGSKVSMAYADNMNNNPSFKKMFDGWKQQKKSLVITMKGKELQQYFNYLKSIHVPFKGGLAQKKRIQHIAYFSKGFIGMASPDEQPEETLQLLERFASVFNLTFTRFNDLQIAEAHALQAEQDLIEIKGAKQTAEDMLSELQLTQKQLIQSEKMASLGELTAGIAHEIQNPLNFVNNFSEVNTELIDELKTELETGNTQQAIELANDIKDNEQKINHHGKRADAIVKGMLQHSRSSTSVKEPTDINALADEYLRLCYHGLRAKDKSFNATFKTDFDETIGKINIIPQDVGRVVLNLLTNAFYVVNEKKKNPHPLKESNQPYEPTVTVTTRRLGSPSGDGGKVEIKVIDNGNGISQKVLDKIFQPFFTTKPTGQGTGLGLSLSYDIIKAHGGEIKVETKEGEGTQFTIILSES